MYFIGWLHIYVTPTGTQFHPADSLDEKRIQNGGLKNINDIDPKNMELGFVDSGRLVGK